MSRQPDPIPSLRKMLDEIRRTLRRMQSASPFFGTGMHPNGDGGIDSDNFEAGVSGYSFKSDGNAEFNDLTLRGGIIGNDALANPVKADYVYTDASGFGVDTVGTTPKMSLTLTTPAGFTTAVVYVTSRVYAINDTAGVDYLFSRTRIDGTYGDSVPYPATGSNGSTVSLDPSSWKVTGLTGGSTFVIDVQAWTAFANWSANASNRGNLNGIVTWYR